MPQKNDKIHWRGGSNTFLFNKFKFVLKVTNLTLLHRLMYHNLSRVNIAAASASIWITLENSITILKF